jgi:hypothetical protein
MGFASYLKHYSMSKDFAELPLFTGTIVHEGQDIGTIKYEGGVWVIFGTQ